MTIADLRREYARASLDIADVDADPDAQFARWMREALACQLADPTAMSLATVSADGRPSCRVVLLKAYDARGLVFYTSYASRKGRDIEANRAVAAVLYWAELERQVRVEGTAEPVAAEESDAYFASRPLASRISAAISPQSAPIGDRATLERMYAAGESRYGEQVPRPDSWGGYRILPLSFEFWQGRANRLHDRLLYRRNASGSWVIERLAP